MVSAPPDQVVQSIQLNENEVRFFRNEGYLYIPELIADDAVAVLREEVLDIMDQLGVSRERLRQAMETADKLRQTTQYYAGCKLDSLINSPDLLSLASQLLEGQSTLYMPFTAVKNGGGGGRFHFHQDNQYTKFDGPGINIWIALEKMTPENGCLQVVPRSHLRGTLDSVGSSDGDDHRMVKVEPSDFLPVRMRAGDAIAFTRLTLHGSAPNVTAEPRVAYAIQFHRNDVKATWDGETHLLKDKPRWNIKPVERIVSPTEKSLDGH